MSHLITQKSFEIFRVSTLFSEGNGRNVQSRLGFFLFCFYQCVLDGLLEEETAVLRVFSLSWWSHGGHRVAIEWMTQGKTWLATLLRDTSELSCVELGSKAWVCLTTGWHALDITPPPSSDWCGPEWSQVDLLWTALWSLCEAWHATRALENLQRDQSVISAGGTWRQERVTVFGGR